MTSKSVLHNFIDGAAAEPADGRYADLIDPSTGEVFAAAPVSGAADVDRAMAAAATAFEKWRDTTPSERQRALLKFADAVEARTDELVAAESQNTGKPLGADRERGTAAGRSTRSGSSPAPPGCSRAGPPGEYLAGYESYVRREPIGVCAQVTPVELPADDGGLEARAGDRGRQHGGAQAVRHHPGHHDHAGRDRRRVPAAGRAQRGHRRPGHRPAAGLATRRRSMVSITGSVRAGMEVAARRRDRPQAHPPGAGRQGPGGDLRRRRPGGGGRGDRRSAGYFNAGQDCTAATRVLAGPRHLLRLRGRADRAGRKAPGPARPTTRTCCTAR